MRNLGRWLLPMAVGHIASMALVAVAVVFGLAWDRNGMMVLAGVLLVGALALRFGRLAPHAARAPAAHAGLASWSFLLATAHGSGLMLVPALMPLCLGVGTSQDPTASGLWTTVLTAAAVHMVAMLAITGVLAGSALHLLAFLRRLHVRFPGCLGRLGVGLGPRVRFAPGLGRDLVVGQRLRFFRR